MRYTGWRGGEHNDTYTSEGVNLSPIKRQNLGNFYRCYRYRFKGGVIVIILLTYFAVNSSNLKHCT